MLSNEDGGLEIVANEDGGLAVVTNRDGGLGSTNGDVWLGVIANEGWG